jgi:hypothetical protein
MPYTGHDVQVETLVVYLDISPETGLTDKALELNFI